MSEELKHSENQPAQTEQQQEDQQVAMRREMIRDMINMDVFLGRTGNERRYDTPGSGFPRWPSDWPHQQTEMAPIKAENVLSTVYVNLETGEIRYERPPNIAPPSPIPDVTRNS